MRKNLITLIVSLLLCGGATAAVIATTARAQVPRKPVMVSMVTPALTLRTAAPPPDGGRDADMAMPSPAEMAAHRSRMCNDHYAHTVGEMAYLETRLDLKPAQQAAFARWKSVRLAAARRDADSCAERPRRTRQAERPSPVDSMAREEDRLKKRLADLSAERPALETLYNTLTPAQRESFARDDRPMGSRGMMLGMMGSMHGRMGGMPPGPPPAPDMPPPPER